MPDSRPTVQRTHTADGRTFDIVLRASIAGTYTAWTVEHVREGRRALRVPGMETFITSREDEAYARACDRIDQWLELLRQTAPGQEPGNAGGMRPSGGR